MDKFGFVKCALNCFDLSSLLVGLKVRKISPFHCAWSLETYA